MKNLESKVRKPLLVVLLVVFLQLLSFLPARMSLLNAEAGS